MKLYWWSESYEAGTPQPFVVSGYKLHGKPGAIRITAPTNATHTEDGGPPHAMLVGLDIQEGGCWKITGEFMGETLSIVVESRARSVQGSDFDVWDVVTLVTASGRLPLCAAHKTGGKSCWRGVGSIRSVNHPLPVCFVVFDDH